MKIKATFTGTDSLGYVNGVEYELIVLRPSPVDIKRTSGQGLCRYDSLQAFLRNWNKISLT